MIDWISSLIGSTATADVVGAAAAVIVIVFVCQASGVLLRIIEWLPRIGGGK